ncbi:MAG: amidohydrolase, partial [Methanobacteriota archaeon]
MAEDGRRTVAATLAVTNARIYTGSATQPWAEALVCEGERIVSIGQAKEVRRRTAPTTEVLDAGGRLVLPGFVDAHVHLIWGYELGTWIDLTGKPSLQEAQRRIATYAEGHPEEEILVGHGFDYVALRPSGLPAKEDLDEAIADRPVLITAWDGHTGLGNTRFVQRALEVHRSLGHDVGRMQRDPSSGEPTGVFHEAFDLTPYLSEFQRRRSLDGLRRTVRMASGFGITTAFDVQVNADDLRAYEALWKGGELSVRVRAALYHPPEMVGDGYHEFLETIRRPWDDWLRVAAVKLYIDGVQETGTAALLEPYTNDPTSAGPTQYPRDVYEAIVEELDRDGFQICTHACGDRGVRIALDAYERAARLNRTSGRRHRIEHCENLADEDLGRFVRLGVIPCMMPRHSSPELTGRWREAVGPVRTAKGFRWRELLDTRAP